MSQVLLFSSPHFRGVITDTPSGMGYSTAPGQTIAADERDVALLLTYGFTPAAPPSASGTSLAIYDQTGDSVTSVSTITFQGVTVSGTTPSGIVNMTTITGGAAVDTTAGVALQFTGGAGNATANAGGVSTYGGAGSSYGRGGDIFSYAGVDGGMGAGGVLMYGGISNTDGAQGGSILFGSGLANVGDADGGLVRITLGAGSGSGVAGQLQVNNDPSMISYSHAWEASAQLGGATGMTIHTSTRAELVTAVIVRLDAANGSTSTLTVVKCASGTAPSGGTALTSDSADLNGTPATNQTLTLSSTMTDYMLAAGDSLCLVTTGTLTLSAGCVTVWTTPQ